jgi:hypothetical protein
MVPGEVVAATRKAGVVWIAVPGQPRPTAAWFVWRDVDSAAYVVTGPGEQPLPGLAAAPGCGVIVPGGPPGPGLTWPAAVSRVEPGSAEWAAVVPGMLGKRLNLADPAAAEQRWAATCAVLRLDPVSLDPVSLDPVSLDPVSLDPVSLDPVSLDPVRPDPVRPDPVRPDPVRPDPVR